MNVVQHAKSRTVVWPDSLRVLDPLEGADGYLVIRNRKMRTRSEQIHFLPVLLQQTQYVGVANPISQENHSAASEDVLQRIHVDRVRD